VDRARRLRDAAFPSRPLLAGSWPIARRGRGGLAAAHLGRLCVTATRLPRLLLAWHRTCRTLRRCGSAPPRRTLSQLRGIPDGYLHRCLNATQKASGICSDSPEIQP